MSTRPFTLPNVADQEVEALHEEEAPYREHDRERRVTGEEAREEQPAGNEQRFDDDRAGRRPSVEKRAAPDRQHDGETERELGNRPRGAGNGDSRREGERRDDEASR